jgi:ACR3 family arsenite transporter
MAIADISRTRHAISIHAALATVVGVLVEVPVMRSVVWIVLRSRPWYQAG